MPLVIAATPIGNVADASPRLAEALTTADVIAAEDTRRLRRLTSTLGLTVTGRVVSFYDAVEQQRTGALLDDLRAGRLVVVVTDAGMPLVSDPGYRLVAAAAAEGLPITVVPGPSAVTAALAVSGLPAARWCFEGFLPRRSGERRTKLTELAAESRTLVFLEAPHRLAATLADLVVAFGAQRPAVVCRELTKTHEEIRRGSLADLSAWAAGSDVKGEITLVVGGADPSHAEGADELALVAEVALLVDGGQSRRDAVADVAARRGISRRALYNAVTKV